jgi:hypothetical protein
MLKMSIPVIVDSLRASKEGSEYAGYANFLFTGGVANVPVNAEQFQQLKTKEGEDLICEFAMKPDQIVKFNRSSCVFVINKFLRIQGQGGK